MSCWKCEQQNNSRKLGSWLQIETLVWVIWQPTRSYMYFSVELTLGRVLGSKYNMPFETVHDTYQHTFFVNHYIFTEIFSILIVCHGNYGKGLHFHTVLCYQIAATRKPLFSRSWPQFRIRCNNLVFISSLKYTSLHTILSSIYTTNCDPTHISDSNSIV